MTELCETDKALWNAFTEAVTPLKSTKAYVSPTRCVTVEPSMGLPHTLDLHGLTLQAAHAETMSFIAAARDLYQMVTVVTGRGGTIKREFACWIEQHPLISRVEELNGGGAYCIHFKR